MEALNLPAFAYKIKKTEGKTYIFDNIRKKYLVLTPEEWVRQHFINYLIQHLHYPKGLIAPERGTTYNTMAKRTDICVYNTAGIVQLLVECKASSVKISEATIQQATTYNQKIKAKFIVLTNGLEHYCWQVDFEKSLTLALLYIPDYEKIIAAE